MNSNNFRMKTLLALVVFGWAAIAPLSAQTGVLFTETFDYVTGTALTANSWTAHSGAGTNPILVGETPLIYAGYTGSGLGKSVTLALSGEDLNRVTGTVTSGSIYAALMVRVNSATTTGDYFFHQGPEVISTIFYNRLFVKRDADDRLAFGIQKISGTGTGQTYTGFDYELGETYLIVVKYEFKAGTADDEVSIVINPAGSTEPTTWDAVNVIGNDAANLGSVALRQGGATTSAGVTLGGIRVGTEYADVVGNPVAPPLSGEYAIPAASGQRGFALLSDAVTALNSRGSDGPVYFLLTSDIVDTNAVIRIDRSDLTAETPLFILPDGDQPRTVHIRQLHNFATPNVYILGSDSFDEDDDTFTARASVARKAVSGLTKDNLGTLTALFDEMDPDEMGPRNLTFNIATATANNAAILLQGKVEDNMIIGINVTMSASQGVNIPAFLLNRLDTPGLGQGGLLNVIIANVGVGSAEAPAKFKDGFQVFGSSTGQFANEAIMLWFNDLHVGHRGLSTQMVRDNSYISNRVWVYGISNQTAHIGFNINTPVGQIAILNNQFLKFETNRSAATDMIGLNLTNALNEDGVFIANNFLAMNHAKVGAGVSGTSDRIIGIAHAGASSVANYFVYHNTVNIPTTSQTGAHAGMMVLGGNAATPFEALNNIFRVTNQGGFGVNWSGTNLSTDFNNYLATTLVRRGTTDYASITALRTSGSDDRSVSREVEFVSNSDLSLTGSSLGDELLAGTNVFIGFDIFGNYRSPLAPYMGAFEGPRLAVSASSFDLLTPENGATVVLTNDSQQNAVITWDRSYSTEAWGGNGFTVFNDAFAHGGNGTNGQGRYLGSTINTASVLETPVLLNVGELRFWVATYNNSTVLTLTVEATTDGETWEAIETYESVNGGTGDINVDWQQKTIELFEDIAIVRFVVGGSNIQGAVYFDDFEVENQQDFEVNFTEDFESWTDFRRIIYKWHLETTGGNFSNPQLTLPSDGNGAEPRLTVSHTALEAAIASLGVGAGRAYTGKWTVTAEFGTRVVFADTPHNIIIQRYIDVGLDETEGPLVFALNQNYPNPFNPSTAITYSVPTTGRVSLNVYTITGQLVTTLVDDVMAPGVHTVTFDASRMASGVYIYRLVADGFTKTHKMTLVK